MSNPDLDPQDQTLARAAKVDAAELSPLLLALKTDIDRLEAGQVQGEELARLRIEVNELLQLLENTELDHSAVPDHLSRVHGLLGTAPVNEVEVDTFKVADYLRDFGRMLGLG